MSYRSKKPKNLLKSQLKVFNCHELPRYNLEHMASYQQGNTLPCPWTQKQTYSSGVQRGKEHFSTWPSSGTKLNTFNLIILLISAVLCLVELLPDHPTKKIRNPYIIYCIFIYLFTICFSPLEYNYWGQTKQFLKNILVWSWENPLPFSSESSEKMG